MDILYKLEISYQLAKDYGGNVAFLHGILIHKAINNEVTITEKELVELTGISERTVRNIISKLIEISQIECIRKGKSNTYRVKPLEGELTQHPDCEPKQPYGAESIVEMTPTQYEKLVKMHGEAKIKDYIERAEVQYHRDGKLLHDYAYIIHRWIAEDKNKPTYQPPKNKNGSLKEEEIENIDKYIQLVNLHYKRKKGDDT